MIKKRIIALDGMGGDLGPSMVIEGSALACLRRPNLHFRIYGNEKEIMPLLERHKQLHSQSDIIHCEIAITMDEKATQAVRRGRKTSSMWQAISAVKEKQAEAVVSAGNTGALMAMSTLILKTQSGIDRPAISAIWPTIKGQSVVLDLGATVNTCARQLVQFAIMGEAYARIRLQMDRPRVGLLNIGIEDIKGTEEVKNAARILKESKLPIDFVGFVEGDGISRGEADVIVTDGFSGNISLKTAEGTARQMAHLFREALHSSLMARIGAVFASSALKKMKANIDPNNSNGGMLLGLNGVVVKSHGGSDAKGYSMAIEVADDVAEANIRDYIHSDLKKIDLDKLLNGDS